MTSSKLEPSTPNLSGSSWADSALAPSSKSNQKHENRFNRKNRVAGPGPAVGALQVRLQCSWRQLSSLVSSQLPPDSFDLRLQLEPAYLPQPPTVAATTPAISNLPSHPPLSCLYFLVLYSSAPASPRRSPFAVHSSSRRPSRLRPAQPRGSLARMPGFDFSNYNRNAALHSRGVPLPKATSTGTTIVGCIYDGGVVVCLLRMFVAVAVDVAVPAPILVPALLIHLSLLCFPALHRPAN